MQSYAYIRSGDWDNFLSQFAPDALTVKDGLIETLPRFQNRIRLFYARHPISDMTISDIRIINPDTILYKLHIELEEGQMTGRRLVTCITRLVPAGQRQYVYRAVCTDRSAPSTIPDQVFSFSGYVLGTLPLTEDLTVTTGQISYLDAQDPANLTIVNSDGRHWHKASRALVNRYNLRQGMNVVVTSRKYTIYDKARQTDKTYFNIISVVWLDAK